MKRLRVMNQAIRGPVDADMILDGLWQGAFPTPGPLVADVGFDKLVLAAEEYQPKASLYPGVDVLLCPLHDDGEIPSDDELDLATVAAELVRGWWRRNLRVLVTCAMGLNRSGLINALALVLDGYDAEQAVMLVRTARPKSLCNPFFVRYVMSFE